MKKGDYVSTPRFLSVKIHEVLSRAQAGDKGYSEPTHYSSEDYEIYGKSTGLNRMIFAAVRK